MTTTGSSVLRELRVSSELAGCPIVALAPHPSGHRLLVLARGAKPASAAGMAAAAAGTSWGAAAGSGSSAIALLVALDTKLLLVARRYAGVTCSSAPLKISISPGVCVSVNSQNTCTHAPAATACFVR